MAFTEEIILKAKDQASAVLKKIGISVNELKTATLAAGASFTAGTAIITDWVNQARLGEQSILAFNQAFSNTTGSIDDMNQATSLGIEYTSAMTKEMDKEAQALFDLADALQNKTGVAGDDIRKMEAQMKQYGLTNQQILEMTPIAVGMMQKLELLTGRQIDTAEAGKIVTEAMKGEGEVLKLLGIDLQKGADGTVAYQEVLKGLQGAVGDTSDLLEDSFTVQWRVAMATIGDLRKELGNVLLPILKDVNEIGIKPLISFIQSLTDTEKKWIVGITVGTTAISGLAFGLGSLTLAITAVNVPLAVMALKIGAMAVSAGILYKIVKEISSVAGDFVGGFGIDTVGLSETAQAKYNQTTQNKKPKIYNGARDYMAEVEEESMLNPLISAGVLG